MDYAYRQCEHCGDPKPLEYWIFVDTGAIAALLLMFGVMIAAYGVESYKNPTANDPDKPYSVVAICIGLLLFILCIYIRYKRERLERPAEFANDSEFKPTLDGVIGLTVIIIVTTLVSIFL